jgi:hypothetical protein
MALQNKTITHLPALPYTILRLDYLIICQGDGCAAKILSLFEAWTESKYDAIAQAQYHNQAAIKEGQEPTHDETNWLYNTLDHIRERLLGEHSGKSVQKALKNLENWGFIQTRFNPNHKWDRTKQYQFQTANVQAAIYQITPEQLEQYTHLRAETLDFLHLVNLPNASGKFTKSIEQNYQMDLVDLPNGSGKSTKCSITKSQYKETNQRDTQNAAPSPQHPNPSVCVLENQFENQTVVATTTETPLSEVTNNQLPSLNISQNSELTINSGSSLQSYKVIKSNLDLVPETLEASATHQSPQIAVKPSERAVNQEKRASRGKTQSKAFRDEFEQWRQNIESDQWDHFITWKAEQAPDNIRDPLAWAYNTLKADLERAKLSFKSFQQQQNPTANRNSSDSFDFTNWEREQHLAVAKQYLADSIGFLKSQSWHKQWVEYINTTNPNLFTEASQEQQS